MTDLPTETDFRRAVSGHPLVLVCFHSRRSAYSRRTMKLLKELEADCSRVCFCALDADQDELVSLLLELRVVGLPTILIFRTGSPAEMLVGERSRKVFGSLLNSILNANNSNA